MHFDEYQHRTAETAIYPEAGEQSAAAITYTALGLAGEAGEVANVAKKMLRDGAPWGEVRERLIGEIGDVLWYCSQLATECDLDLSEIAAENLGKLLDRKMRGVLGGSGDHR
jgi:NTP pyrophosphatase (non-canonical NTP hydrolase)